MTVKLLTEHHLELLNLKGGCTGLSESTLVKMPHCWKSHVAAQLRACTLIRFNKVMRTLVNSISIVQSPYNTPHNNVYLDITWSCPIQFCVTFAANKNHWYFTSASALVIMIYVSKLPLGACLIRACSISKLQKWIRC